VVRHLPRGVALIRVDTPIGRIVWVSDRLLPDQQRGARLIACERIHRGLRAGVIGELELYSLLEEANAA
jgi:hypothetical protein